MAGYFCGTRPQHATPLNIFLHTSRPNAQDVRKLLDRKSSDDTALNDSRAEDSPDIKRNVGRRNKRDLKIFESNRLFCSRASRRPLSGDKDDWLLATEIPTMIENARVINRISLCHVC